MLKLVSSQQTSKHTSTEHAHHLITTRHLPHPTNARQAMQPVASACLLILTLCISAAADNGTAPYCCGGVGNCSIPVPQPPATLPAVAAVVSSTTAAAATAAVLQLYANASRTFLDPQNILPADEAAPPARNGKSSSNLALCAAHPRMPLTSPLSALQNNTVWLVTYWGDTSSSRPKDCKWSRSNLLLSGCTGSQIAPHLVLTAAHCVDISLKRKHEGCERLTLLRVVLCYDAFTRQPGDSRECGSSGVEAVGVSWHAYPETGQPNDQAIIFTSKPRPGPYFQYNYIENLNGHSNSSSAATAHNTNATFLAHSFSGDGTPAGQRHPRCGCKACPNTPCGLARTGPSHGPLLHDARRPGNGAVSARLEACGGSSGSCLTVNGDSCCVAVDSYSKNGGDDPCTSVCESYWSSISAAKPLSLLWARVQHSLPR